MSNLSQNSLAAAVAAGVENVQFSPSAEVLQRKIAVIGTYDPAKTEVVDEVPLFVTSPEDVGDRTGFGFMLHRLAVQTFLAANGIPVYIIPQTETSAQAAGTITFSASSLLAGTVYMYIAGILVDFVVAKDDDATAVAAAALAAVTAMKELPVTGAVNAGELTLTSKSEGLWGNDISLALNIYGEESPSGLSVVVVNMVSGAGTPDIQGALDGMGTGDGANEDFFTDVVHGYGQVTAVLDAIATYVGLGNDLLGLYGELVARPFRSLSGDIATGSAGLTAILAVGNGRKTDRANGIISVPDSMSHPEEIAAQAMGHMARINNNRAEESYINVILQGIHPGDKGADRWTSEYSNRDTAVKAGISPTLVKNGVVVLQNVVSFYHPDSVPITSNGYRSMRNISIIQNMLNSVITTFEAVKWEGISIVGDVSKVTNSTDRLKSRDLDDVRSDLVALAKAWESNAWIYEAQFTIDKLKIAGAIAVRAGTNGFDSIVPVIFSGEGLILNTLVQFDTSIAVLN
ncbi:hypothetical protein KAR10_07355 [bacterium]|nr:hypothetical protein [bacterium]